MTGTLKDFVHSLLQSVRGEVLSDEASLGIYSTDASVYQVKPVVVVLPLDEADVAMAIRLAREAGVSILPRGGGTSLAGQTVGHSMVLDFSRHMDRILELNVTERWVRVQPGVVLDVLNFQLKNHDLHFAIDPATSSRANIGGMVGNNSSGTKSILYGKTVDHILEARVLLADGTQLHLKRMHASEYECVASGADREAAIYKGVKELILANRTEVENKFPKVMRRVGGYNFDEFIHTDEWNLAKLITGSEGTLATTLEIKLNLLPLPKHKSVCVVHFSNLHEAIAATEPILVYKPAAVEILDRTVLGLSRDNLTTKNSCHFIDGDPEAVLIVEFYDDDATEVMSRAQRMIDDLRTQSIGYAWPLFPQGKSYEDVWVIRKKGLGLMLGMKSDRKPTAFIEDAGIPIRSLPEYIDRVLALCKAHGAGVAMYAHASVGVIHVRPILDLRQAGDIQRFEKIAQETFALVKHYKGSWSGEHGDGLVRSPFNREFFGPQLYQAFVDLKRLFDPDNLMNPGKIVEAPPMTENLRYGAKYHEPAIETVFHFREDRSFSAAVHMCTGVGECRKLLGGTMCPSFKATRDEEHSTRGRANALRLALSGQLDHNGLAGERLHEVLDLCLSCKACKSECPSNVDMARLKGEVSQAYFDKHGTTLRDRLVRDSSDMARRWSGRMASVVNGVQKVMRPLISRTAGFAPNRELPLYASETFAGWFSKNAKPSKGPTVALFADTYLNYHEPHIGRAAYELLTSCGYNVVLADVGCCQRPRISHGFLKEAKKHGTVTASSLDHFLSAGIPVVVCEPSCASALNDDLPDLIDDESLASRLKHGAWMIDQFLANELASGRLNATFESEVSKVMVHGHCHQKALYGTGAMKSLLSSVKSMHCEEVNSGCCGMAGSFGYEKEHYALSKKIGEEILFPAVRNLAPETTVVACGFSCRHQIRHFTGIEARHWVEVIRGRVKDA